MQRALWTILSTGLTVAATLAARRLAVKVWAILTGEQAPRRI